MKRLVNSARLLNPRAVLIVGVLVSLCVSDNVGPRLLPLPPPPELASAQAPSGPEPTASHIPSHGRTLGARVEMVSAQQSRAGAERQSPHATAHIPEFKLAIPSASGSLRREAHPPLAESSAHFSRPKGRAPPRLV